MGVYYLVHNIAFIAWVLHHNSSQVSNSKSPGSVKPEKSHDLTTLSIMTKVRELGVSLWSTFNMDCQFLFFCHLLIFVGVFSFVLLILQIVMRKEQ